MLRIGVIRRLVDAATDALRVLAERDRLVDEVDMKLAMGNSNSAHNIPEDIAIRLEGFAPHHTNGDHGVLEEAWKQEKEVGEVELGLKEEIKVDMSPNRARTTFDSAGGGAGLGVGRSS